MLPKAVTSPQNRKENTMKYFYYAVVNEENGKYFAYAERVREGNNIKSYFEADDIIIVHPCGTFKEAKEIAEYWNECYKKNGTYMF